MCNLLEYLYDISTRVKFFILLKIKIKKCNTDKSNIRNWKCLKWQTLNMWLFFIQTWTPKCWLFLIFLCIKQRGIKTFLSKISCMEQSIKVIRNESLPLSPLSLFLMQQKCNIFLIQSWNYTLVEYRQWQTSLGKMDFAMNFADAHSFHKKQHFY